MTLEPVCDNARHLVCRPYSIANLHEMAKQVGIKRCWFHKNHYDIPKRDIARIMGLATVVESATIVKIIREASK